jgi:VanZ family protein
MRPMANRGGGIRPWAALVPAAAYYAGIFWLSSQSRLPVGPSFPLSDKLAHGLLFAGFGAALRLGFGTVRPARPFWAARASLWLGALGAILDEFHQAFVPLRNPDPWDAAADVAGILAALGVISLIRKRREKTRSRVP